MNIKEIKELIRIMDETAITELEWESGGERLSIRKQLGGGAGGFPPSVSPGPSESQDATSTRPQAPAADQAQGGDGRLTINAPMVGTFYRAPAPDADPYVSVGQVIEPGQPLCIIEAMKVMNEIESEFRGRVLEVLVENAQPVEYGQPLFVLEKL